MVFLGSRLYMQEMNQSSREAHSTALVLLSTRIMGNYTSIEEMVKPDSKSPWGNHFAFLQVPIPKLTEFSNALDFVLTMKKGTIDPQKLKLCMENAHDMIFNASDKYPVENSTEK